MQLVESCEKLHTADISHESNIYLGSPSCKSKGRIEPFTINHSPCLPSRPAPHLCYVTALMLFKHLYNMSTLVKFQWMGWISLCTQKLTQLQWPMHSQYEEDKFVILLGEVHMEMTCYKVLGHWLEGRRADGWNPPGGGPHPNPPGCGACHSWNCTPLPQGLACHRDPACPSRVLWVIV